MSEASWRRRRRLQVKSEKRCWRFDVVALVAGKGAPAGVGDFLPWKSLTLMSMSLTLMMFLNINNSDSSLGKAAPTFDRFLWPNQCRRWKFEKNTKNAGMTLCCCCFLVSEKISTGVICQDTASDFLGAELLILTFDEWKLPPNNWRGWSANLTKGKH